MVSQAHKSSTVVFSDLHYPQTCTEAVLQKLVPRPFEIVNAAQLARSLDGQCKLLVSFHGPYFPKAAWEAILRFLERGGHMAVFGGVPFARPTDEDGEAEPEQDTYTRQIYLGPFFQASLCADSLQLVAHEEAILLKDCPLHLPPESPGNFWSFYPKLTQSSDHPEDMGSAGPFDTVLKPLIRAIATTSSGKKCQIATPAFLLDQHAGRFRGGRWLISAWQPFSEETWQANAEAIQRVILLASEELATCEVHPTLACYQPGEIPTLVTTARTSRELQANIALRLADSSKILRTFNLVFPPSPVQQEQRFTLPSPFQPGLYTLELTYQAVDGQTLAATNGFWIWDESLVETTHNKRLKPGRDYFFQEEEIFFVCGTTYMDSQVQRRFLHLPNPARWNKEMGEFKTAGINLIRTGIWTAWREFFPLAGSPNEAFLRALDAFVMSVCKHNIQLIFTFFSFSPPLFEGENPWLDPHAIEAQQDFVALLASRFAKVELLSWDLINEPSFGDPKRIFALRPIPNYDRFEIAAFQQWLKNRYTLSELQLRWRKTPAIMPTWRDVLPPNEADYDTYVRSTTVRSMLQVADYTRFSQEMFHAWAARMVEAIRAGGSQTLVGVGQDEAGSRIAPQYYGSSVDYTTTHPWWNIDDLLWDMLIDKTPDQPNLIQETGIMQLFDVDGRPWRNEWENAYLLERKLITALIARGAGVIQWQWFINSYMTSDNENSIGLVRVDGSAKPELEIIEEFGRLTLALAGRMRETPSLPDVWVVIPYTQWFVRAELARYATQQAVRLLGHDLGTIPQMVGEHHLQILSTPGHQPQTIIVPAVQLLDSQAWECLLQYVHRGGTLLVNGVISRDAHNLKFDSGIDGIGEELPLAPVSHYEFLENADGSTYQVAFADEKMSYVKKAHNFVQSYSYGEGSLIWCGLPLELANEQSATRALYQEVIRPDPEKVQSNSPYLIASQPLKDGTLILVVSESSHIQHITLDEGQQISIDPNRAGALILGVDQTIQTFGGLHC